jgi:predicted glycoside hydrolase/deacetylase ChbG (UPF0249 family)
MGHSKSVDGARDHGSRLRRVAFHADDLGMSAAVDRGILTSFDRGLLTSTSVLANGPTAAAAICQMQALEHRRLSGGLQSMPKRRALGDPMLPFDLGVHLNLTQGRPLTGIRYPAELLDTDGRFPGAGRLFAAMLRYRRRFAAAMTAELNEQITFVTDHGVAPTHANGHQYLEMFPFVSPIVVELLARRGIQVVRVAAERRLMATTLRQRGLSAWLLGHVKRSFAARSGRRVRTAGLSHAEIFFGASHAGHVTEQVLAVAFERLPVNSLIEVGVHPGDPPRADESVYTKREWFDPLAAMRPIERSLLSSDELSGLLARHRLGLGRLQTLRSKAMAA